MDPNVNLEEQLEIAARIEASEDTLNDIMRLAELVAALDTWISKGGFLPNRWKGIVK